MKKTSVSHPVSELVQRALDNIREPYPESITDEVCLAIERNRDWYRSYKRLLAEHGERAVNPQIGRSTLQLTHLKNLGKRGTATSSLMKTYTKLGYR